MVNMTSSSNSYIPHSNEGLTRTLERPINRDSSTVIVSLIPCMHEIDRISVITRFGKMIEGVRFNSDNQTCPTCNRIVTSYYPDDIMLPITSCLLGKKKESSAETTSASASPAALEKEEKKEMSYPGKRSTFIHESGEWIPSNQNGLTCYTMTFASFDSAALFSDFRLLSRGDNRLILHLTFKKEQWSGLKNYLTNHQITTTLTDGLPNLLRITDITQIRKMLAILAENNTIPSEYLEKVRAIVTRGTAA